MRTSTADDTVATGAVTRRDVALAAGVSVPTVSFALTNHPRVSARTRRHVMDAAERLGYVPNHAARRLARFKAAQRAVTFEQIGFMYVADGLFVPDPVCIAMMNGAEQALAALSACLIFVRADGRSWDHVERLVRSRLVDGWLLAGRIDDGVVDRLNRVGVPHVVLGDHHCTRPIHCVNADHFAVGRMAARTLVELGHRDIAFTGGNLDYDYLAQTLAGFRTALRAVGIKHDDRQIILGDLKKCLASAPTPPTAIFCAEPFNGESFQRSFAEMGVRVPGDMSLLVCDLAGAQGIARDVSHIDLPMGEVGRQAAQLLNRLVLDPQIERCEMRLPAALVDRGSIGAPAIRGQLNTTPFLEERGTS